MIKIILFIARCLEGFQKRWQTQGQNHTFAPPISAAAVRCTRPLRLPPARQVGRSLLHLEAAQLARPNARSVVAAAAAVLVGGDGSGGGGGGGTSSGVGGDGLGSI